MQFKCLYGALLSPGECQLLYAIDKVDFDDSKKI